MSTIKTADRTAEALRRKLIRNRGTDAMVRLDAQFRRHVGRDARQHVHRSTQLVVDAPHDAYKELR